MKVTIFLYNGWYFHGWRIVGSWLAEYWFIVGGLMLGQRVSNEQSNVGPTKYVAVGPTLNQRLGFGWQMVDVLAGVSRCFFRALIHRMLSIICNARPGHSTDVDNIHIYLQICHAKGIYIFIMKPYNRCLTVAGTPIKKS